MSLPHTTYVEMLLVLNGEIDSLYEWPYGDFQSEICELLESTKNMAEHLMKVVPTPSFPSDTTAYRLPHHIFMNKYEMLSKELQMIADFASNPTHSAVDRLTYDVTVARNSYTPTADYDTFCDWRDKQMNNTVSVTCVKMFLHSLSASASASD